MFGIRDAAQGWQKKCAETMRELGFEIGCKSPRHLHHRGTDSCGMVHRGFVFGGTDSFLKDIAKHMDGKFSIKVATTGPGRTEAPRVLIRSTRWTSHRIEYKCDHRHAEQLIEELELRPGQKVITPVVRE